MSPLSVTCLFGHDYRNVGGDDRILWACWKCGKLRPLNSIDITGDGMSDSYMSLDDMLAALEAMSAACMEIIGAATELEEAIDENVENFHARGMDPHEGMLKAKEEIQDVKQQISTARHTIYGTQEAIGHAKRG